MSPRPDVSEERKDQIMNAAEEVFSQKGFSNARMDDIAEETGLSKGTVYLYYKSKDDLIIAILNRIFQRDFQGMDALDMGHMTATDSIWKFAEHGRGSPGNGGDNEWGGNPRPESDRASETRPWT